MRRLVAYRDDVHSFGHRVARVVDTVHPRYVDAGRFGAPLTLSGPSRLALPVR